MIRVSLLERVLFWVCSIGVLAGVVVAGIGYFHENSYGINDLTHLVSPGLLTGMACCSVMLLLILLLALRSKHT